jgi:hypothetical protein
VRMSATHSACPSCLARFASSTLEDVQGSAKMLLRAIGAADSAGQEQRLRDEFAKEYVDGLLETVERARARGELDVLKQRTASLAVALGLPRPTVFAARRKRKRLIDLLCSFQEAIDA